MTAIFLISSMGTAHAQVLSDFDGTGLTWAGSGFGLGVPAAGAWSGNALVCTDICYAESQYFLTTHTAIGFVGVTDEPYSADLNSLHGTTYLIGPAGVWTAAEVDTAVDCGVYSQLFLDAASDTPGVTSAIDDLTWGPLCPEYADLDGDSLCTLGHDTDGDGACTGEYEAWEKGTTDPIDCDDTRPGPACPIPFDVVWTDTSPSISPLGFPIPLGEVYVSGGTPICYALSPGFLTEGQCSGVSSDFPVTHQTLTASMRATGSVSDGPSLTMGWAGEVLSGVSALGVWQVFEADVSIECGRSATLGWSGRSFVNDDATFELDALDLVGEVCPEYIDGDGDGACLAGTDLDGDGRCISDGEPRTVDDIIDCDDATYGFECLSLTVSEVVSDQWTLTARGATPGETVGFVASDVLGTACRPELGGRCFAMPTTYHQRARVDASGVATVTFDLSAVVLPYGTPIYAQAAVIRGAAGEDSLLSNVGHDFAR